MLLCVYVCSHTWLKFACLLSTVSHGRQHFLELFNHLISKLYAPLYQLLALLSRCVAATPHFSVAWAYCENVFNELNYFAPFAICHLPLPFFHSTFLDILLISLAVLTGAEK